MLVRSVIFLSDATIPFQIKPWEYEDWMKNSDKKVNVGAFRDAQKQYLGGGRDYSHTWIITEMSHPTLCSNRDDMIYTLLLIPEGGTTGNSWWGCGARFSESWPSCRPKNVIFHTRFQTRSLKSIPIFRPGARFSKVPIINGPGKLSPFTLTIEVSIVLHLTL